MAPTRKDSTNALNTPPDAISAEHMPPARPRKKALASVDAPLTNLSLNNLIYILSIGAVLLGAFYAWRIVGYSRAVGGWWNLALGKKAAPTPAAPSAGVKWFRDPKDSAGEGRPADREVEDRINALAEALGMPPTHLASAIASAVREHVPPASLSSVAASEPTGAATKVLLGDESEGQAAEGVVGTAAGILGSAVGMEEPPEA
ncbi:hypothetical protein HWV62_42699 [Athelia sp. TMB]|nr:hypothetical protein HWV62_42699 [Athelia sp. TMB]